MSKKRKQKKKVQKKSLGKTTSQPLPYIPPQKPSEFPIFVESENGERQVGFLNG